MKLTSKKIMEIYNCLNELVNKELDFHTSCMIADNIKKLSTPNEVVERKIHRLANEYADRDENGNFMAFENGSFKLKEETALEYHQKITELFNSETEIDIKPVSANALSDIKISPGLIIILKDNGLLVDGKN